MRFGQLLMRFCRSQTVAVGLRVTTATLMIVALLSPANAQFWGDSWGGVDGSSNANSHTILLAVPGRSARGLLGRSAEGKPSVPASEGKG